MVVDEQKSIETSAIYSILKNASNSHVILARKVKEILVSFGFEAHSLDDTVAKIAEAVGEEVFRLRSTKEQSVDMAVNFELDAAHLINMESLDSQLVFLAAFYNDEKKFISVVEKELSINISV